MSSHNILVISDLHLGEGIRPLDAEGDPRVEALDRALQAFLDHYTANRRGNLPWRLVINGDMVDFIAVCLMPADVELLTGLHPDDHLYGLGARSQAAAVKMRTVAERHAGVFRALARFVGHGNDVALVLGNHDADFHFPEVQALLKQILGQMWDEDPSRATVAGRPRALRTGAEVSAAVAFHPWFYLEEGVAWIEHGHQYDPYCSFDDVLSPSTDERELDPNVGTAILRYVAVHFTRDVSKLWGAGFLDYLTWWFHQGAWKGVLILGSYRDMVLRLVAHWREQRPERIRQRREKAGARLRKLAAAARLPVEALVELRRLQRRPVVNDLRRLVRAVMLDRLLLLIVAPMLLAIPLILLPWTAWPVALAIAVLIPWLWVALEEREPVDPRAAMRKVSAAIRRRARVPFVVFGHSHDPVAEQGDDKGWYFNTGSWMPHDVDKGLLQAFTHLVVERTEKGVKARLCQWRDGQSAAFTEHLAEHCGAAVPVRVAEAVPVSGSRGSPSAPPG